MSRSTLLAALAAAFVISASADNTVAVVGATPLPVPLCILWIDGTPVFNFGGLLSNGTMVSFIKLPTWQEVGNGIDAGEDNTTFYSEPGIAAASRGIKRHQQQRELSPVQTRIQDRFSSSTLSLSSSSQVNGATIAQLKIAANKKSVTASYTYLQPAPGHTQYPDSIADMNADTVRNNQIVGTVQSNGEGPLFFLIADLSPSNGSITNVWVDITSEWSTWAWMKYGVSCYNSISQIYYLVVGITKAGTTTETILGFPLNGTAQIPLPSLPGYDILALRFSSLLSGPITLNTDRNKGTITILGYSENAWGVIYSYPISTVTSMELGQMEVSADGSVVIASLEDANTGEFIISYVSVVTKKEIARYTIQNKDALLADIVLCDI